MTPPPDKTFLDTYFGSIYEKLEADALLFNRRLPHQALKGSENEKVLADVLREFLPVRYGVEQNALVVDRHGNTSRQCDIVIFDSVQFPRYLRKIYPVETVHAVIEVKTELTCQRVRESLENEAALRALDFYPALTNFWRTRTTQAGIPHQSPTHCIFGFRTDTEEFGTVIRWLNELPTSKQNADDRPSDSPFHPFLACSLDKGMVFCRGDGHVSRWLAVADEPKGRREFPAVGDGHKFSVDPAKALFFFLETLWTMLEQSPRHPGFDIRTYASHTFVQLDFEGKVEDPEPHAEA